MKRILALAHKEALQIRRDHVLPRLIVGLPVLMLLLFGYAINFTLSHIQLSVFDASNDRISQALLRELTKDGRFNITYIASGPGQVPAAIDSGKARVGLSIPPGALEAVRKGRSVPVEVWVDGSDPNFAFQAQAQLRKSFGEVNARVLAGKALAGEGFAQPVTPTIHTLYNPDNKTAWFMIPGIIVLILNQFTVLLTSLAIVRESEGRMLESLIASPIKPYEVVLGKVLPYLGIAFVVSLLVLGVGHWVFGVPIRGSLPLLLVLIFLFVLGSLGVGVLISTLAGTQIQAVFGTFAYVFPAIFLSGFVFPVEGMPAFFQGISYLVPARYLVEVLRGIVLKGVGLEVLWPDLIALAVFSVGVLGLASFRFGKRLAA